MSAVLLASALMVGPQYSARSFAQDAISTEDDFLIELSLTPSIVEYGLANYDLGYIQLVSNKTGEPVLAPRDLEVELSSRSPSIASVPAKIVVSKGSDYAQFTIGVTGLIGESEISALFGNGKVTKTLKVVEAGSQVPNDVSVVLNLPSNTMQIGSEVPFSVYLENNGEIMQAPEDVTVTFDYDRSLLKLSSSSVTIKKGDYYGLDTVRTLEKSGNAFIKAFTISPPLDTVSTVRISQTQPAALKLSVFPEKVGVNEKTVDVFVGLVDSSGNPTVASADIRLDLFASAPGVQNVDTNTAMIKKGEFGFYSRQSIIFYSKANVTIGATAPGLGVSTDSFEVVEKPLLSTGAKAQEKYLSIFTIASGMPGDSSSIIVYQLNAIEDDDDDGTDTNGDGEVDSGDHHPIDDLAEGELYPIQSGLLYSSNQGNLNVVTTDLTALRVVDTGSITAGSSYGTAVLASGRQPGPVDVSVSLANTASNTNSMTITGSLTPVQSMIFSPAGEGSSEQDRIHFNQQGLADLFVLTLDSEKRPARAESGVQYLIEPMNEITEIEPDATFSSLQIRSSQFSSIEQVATISAIPVGVNADPDLQVESTFNTVFYSSITGKVMFPFESVIGFSKTHPIGTVQLTDVFGNPLLASEDVTITLSSPKTGSVVTPTVTIPQGKSFANFVVATSGKAESLMVSAFADGMRSTTSGLLSVLADLPAAFAKGSALMATQQSTITIQTDEGTSVVWNLPAGLKVVSKEGKATTFDPATNTYSATAQVIASKPGSYIIDATLLKDGYKPTRISDSMKFAEFQKPLEVVIFHNSPSIEYNEPVTMNVRVVDSNSMPVAGAMVRINPGPNATAVPTEGVSDSSGIVTFVYTPTGAEARGTVTATAEKAGYSMGVKNTAFEVQNVPTVIPPWIIFGIAGAAAAGAGAGAINHIKKPKIEQPVRRARTKKPAQDDESEDTE
ncbi:MAG TPA: hypothetical protein VGQ03_09605 [Nitrososphaera sp.]|nr:hypothetical protein [Nitrososphaera sp.]